MSRENAARIEKKPSKAEAKAAKRARYMDSIKANLAIQYRLNNKVQTGDLHSESTGTEKAEHPQKQQTISTISTALSTNGDPTSLAVKA